MSEPAPPSPDADAAPAYNAQGVTEEEMGWARDIKAAATDAGLAPLTDFEYLHHALVAKTAVKKALKRIKGVADFREQYKLSSPEEDKPMELFAQTLEMFPNFCISMGKDTENRYSQLFMYKDFDPKKLKGEKEWRIMMGAFYYMFQGMCCTPEAIRNGIIFSADCDGMGWKNFSLEVEKRASTFYQDAYPIRMKHIYMLDAPKMINIVIDICKVFLSKKIKGVIQTRKADEYFVHGAYLPNDLIPQNYGGTATEESLFKNMEEMLQTRTENELNFIL